MSKKQTEKITKYGDYGIEISSQYVSGGRALGMTVLRHRTYTKKGFGVNFLMSCRNLGLPFLPLT